MVAAKCGISQLTSPTSPSSEWLCLDSNEAGIVMKDLQTVSRLSAQTKNSESLEKSARDANVSQNFGFARCPFWLQPNYLFYSKDLFE